MSRLAVGDLTTIVPSPKRRDEVGVMARTVQIFKDNALALRDSRELLSLALNSGSDGLWDMNVVSGEVHLTGNWLLIIGYEEGEVEPTVEAWRKLTHPDDAWHFRAVLIEHLKGQTPMFACEYRIRSKAGNYLWTLARGKVVSRDPDGRARRLVGTHIDITKRKEAEQALAHMALHDALTGLPNRALFYDRLTHKINHAERQGYSFAVLACDLDRFKAVNDTLGHAAGDELLRKVAELLKAVTSEADTVARLGGDEFAIILERLPQAEDAGLIAQRAIDAIERPFEIDGRAISIGLSVGIAVAPENGQSVGLLFKNADIALYRAKAEGRNTYRFFERGMDSLVAERTTLERDLRYAVKGGGFVLHYQPVFSVASGAMTSLEALLRWQHPTRGLISPAEFIPLAEETGLIVALGDRALREACREASSWPHPLRVAVNVSAVQFQQPESLKRSVLLALASSHLPPNRLELEITESALLQDAEAVIACLHSLRELGVRIALDDFGTGYSSLSYLRRFPFSKIKIDRTFVRDIGEPVTAAIVRAVVGLGTRMNADITAEGVETEEQLVRVREEGCTEIQGFLFSRRSRSRTHLHCKRSARTA